MSQSNRNAKSSAAASGSNSNAATVKRLMKAVGTKCKPGPNSSICFPVEGKVRKLGPTELMDVHKLTVDEKTVVVMFKLTGKGAVANCEVNANVYDINGKIGYTVSTGLGNVNSLTLEAVRKPSTEARRVNDANRQRRDVEDDEPVDVDADSDSEEDEQDSDVEEQLRPAAEPVDDVEPVEPLEPLPQPQLDVAALIDAAVEERFSERERLLAEREEQFNGVWECEQREWREREDREKAERAKIELAREVARAEEAKLARAQLEFKTADLERQAMQAREAAALAEEAAIAGKAELALAEAKMVEAKTAYLRESAKAARPAVPKPIGGSVELPQTPIFKKRPAEDELEGPPNKAQKTDESAAPSQAAAADDEPEEAMILHDFHVASPDTQPFAEAAVSQQKEQEDDEASE